MIRPLAGVKFHHWVSISGLAVRFTNDPAIADQEYCMRYMLLIYSSENQQGKPSVEDFERGMSAHRALMEETTQRGILLGASPLKPSATATTIRGTADGTRLVTDGPFAETKEQLGGYYLLECKDLDEAIAYAKRIPLRCAAGSVGAVEVRPVMEFAEIQQRFEELVASQHA